MHCSLASNSHTFRVEARPCSERASSFEDGIVTVRIDSSRPFGVSLSISGDGTKNCLCHRQWSMGGVFIRADFSICCYTWVVWVPQLALASLISWHLGQPQAGLSHHWAPVTPLAGVQPNLWAFWAPLWTLLSWGPGLLPYSAVWPYMILRPGSHLLSKCIHDAFSLLGAKWLAVWNPPLVHDHRLPCAVPHPCFVLLLSL